VFGAGGLGQKAGGLRPPLTSPAPPASPAPTGLACPHQPRLPPSASPATIGLACPHGEEEGSALVLGIGLRLWQSALGFPSLSFIYKSIVFLLFGSTDNSSSSLLLHHLLVSTMPGMSTPLIKPWVVCMMCREGANYSWRCINFVVLHTIVSSPLWHQSYLLYIALLQKDWLP
jgi:hypothetical protein